MSSKHVGKKFGKLVVLDAWTKRTSGGGYKMVSRVRCDCGAVYDVNLEQVTKAKNPKCKSCRMEEYASISSVGYKHPLYSVWLGMISRCGTPANAMYKYYGGRGIRVCERWLAPTKNRKSSLAGFKNFVADMGDRPDKTSIDRIDVNGHYEPSNCRWATQKEQANNKTCSIYVEINGVVKTVTQWSDQVGTTGWYAAAKLYGVDPAEALKLTLMETEKHRWDWQRILGVERQSPKEREKTEKAKVALSDEDRAVFSAWLDSLN